MFKLKFLEQFMVFFVEENYGYWPMNRSNNDCVGNAFFIETSYFKMIGVQKKLFRKGAFFLVRSDYSCFSDALIFRRKVKYVSFSGLFLLELLQI